MTSVRELGEDVPLRIEMWGDIQCAWCYIQHEALKRVVAELGAVEVRFRTYSQFPHAHAGDGPSGDRSGEDQLAIEQVATQLALDYDCTSLRRGDSQSAHELIHFASARGREAQVVDQLYRARFAQDLDVGELETLGAVAVQSGLDQDEATTALQEGWCSAEVEQNNHLAYLLRVPGVPFVTINGSYSVRGVRAPAALRKILTGARRSTLVGEHRGLAGSDGNLTVDPLVGEVGQG